MSVGSLRPAGEVADAWEAAPGKALAPSLRRNFSWAVLGDVVYAGCQWGMVVALAKLGSPELLGQFSLGLAVTAPVFMLATLHLRALQATEGERQDGFAPYLTLRLLLSGLSFLALVGLVGFTGYSAQAKAVVLAVALFKGVELVSDIFHGELQRRADMKWISISVILKGTLGLTVLALGVWLAQPLALVCLLIAAAWLLILFGLDARRVAHWGASLQLCRNTRRLWELFIQAFPLGVVAMLISLTLSVPRYFLEHGWGDATLGVYSALAALMQASTLPAAALGSAASARLGVAWATRDVPGTIRLLCILLGLAAAFGFLNLAIVWLGGPVLLAFFYAPEYAAHHEDFCLLMLAAVGTNVCFILNWAVISARYLRVQIPFHLGLLVATVAVCALLIPDHGLRGAVWSVAISTGCAVLGTGFLVWYALRGLRADVVRSSSARR